MAELAKALENAEKELEKAREESQRSTQETERLLKLGAMTQVDQGAKDKQIRDLQELVFDSYFSMLRFLKFKLKLNNFISRALKAAQAKIKAATAQQQEVN